MTSLIETDGQGIEEGKKWQSLQEKMLKEKLLIKEACFIKCYNNDGTRC